MSESLEDIRKALQTRIDFLTHELNKAHNAMKALESVEDEPDVGRPTQHGRYSEWKTSDAMRDYLRKRGGKINMRIIAQDLLSMGSDLGRSPVRTISIAAATNPEEFVKDDEGMIWLGRDENKLIGLKRKRKQKVS